MKYLIKPLAGLPFRVISPSLYALMLERGTCALRYNGEQWEFVLFSCDQPESIHLMGTFDQAVEWLEEGRFELQKVQQ